MAETLGSLCDKLTILQLKIWHSEQEDKLKSLHSQAKSIENEIDHFVSDVIVGNIPIEKITFSSNKVYNQKKNIVDEIKGTIGNVFSELSKINCELWHEQEKVYSIEDVPSDLKDRLIKQLANLNLKRNKCIDCIDITLSDAIKTLKSK